MSGFITKAECEAHRNWIVETWGQDFFDACLISEGKTFLGLLVEMGRIQLTRPAILAKIRAYKTTSQRITR